MRRGALRTALATAGFAAIHSLLASRAAKKHVARLLGEQRQKAFYRLFYIAQSLVTFMLLVVYLGSRPTRVLYHLRGPAAAAMRLGQASGIIYAFYAALQIGLLRITGLASLLAWLRGDSVPATPEAQGPALDQRGALHAAGPFAWSRHPLNFAPLPFFWLTPRMTTRRLFFNLIATCYLMLGSAHEEARLRAAYGDQYEQYLRSGVPFYLPLPRIARPGRTGRGAAEREAGSASPAR